MYEEHFGLTAKPFQLSPDAGFFFPSAEHLKALAFLRYGLSQEDGFIVITGNVGTGKTMLVRTLLDELGDELAVSTIVTSNLQEHDLLQMVATSFGLTAQSLTKADLLHALNAYFTAEHKAGRRILLIVDEAQNIPSRSIEELRMLSNFNCEGKPLVQIFLLGQQEFRATLLSPGFEQLRQRVIATHHLKPLCEAETRSYIEHRLEIVGWTDHPQFTKAAHELIYSFTEGIPRRVNNLCDRLLLYAHLEGLACIDRRITEDVSNEIGEEFIGRSPAPVRAPHHNSQNVFDDPHESLTQLAYEGEGLLSRVTEVEQDLTQLREGMHPELTVIRKELSVLRVLMREMMRKVTILEQARLAAQPGSPQAQLGHHEPQVTG